MIPDLLALLIVLFWFLAPPALGQSPTGPLYQVGVLPPDAKPVIPPGDDIIVYIHGGPGSRLEEASDLVKWLLNAGVAVGKRYTVISFDQPSQGYSSMVDPVSLVPPPTPQAQQGPAPVQIPFPIIASQDDHFPGSGGYMHTDVSISKNGDGSGNLHAVTRTQEVTDLRGFRGAVAVALLDGTTHLLWVSKTQNYGVDGRKVPFGKPSDRTDPLDDTIPAQLLQQARHIAIVQRWNPKSVFDDLNSFLHYVGDVASELGNGLQAVATVTGIVPNQNKVADYYPLLASSEEFIRGFLDRLNQVAGLYNHNVYIIGGSTGGALTLRMGHLQDPWIKKIVAWNPASVWTTYTHDAAKATALLVAFNSANAPEDLASRGGFFKSVYGPPLPTIQPNPEEWYRGDRKHYYPLVGTQPYGGTPASPEWACKWQYIAASRLEMEEVYNPAYRRWHFRLGGDMLTFSFFNDDWYGPANTAAQNKGKPANYEAIVKPTLLVAGQDDDWDEGNGLHWENRWTQTRDMAAKMMNTPRSTLFLLNTGHSVHNERPQFFAQSIVKFLSGNVATTGPLQVLADIHPAAPVAQSPTPPGDEPCQQPFDVQGGQPPQFPRIPVQLLDNPASATYLTQPANLGGKFSDGTDPGHYTLRLRRELRAVAQRRDPAYALGAAAASYYHKDNVMGNAYADLSVTGRGVYDAFRNHPPSDVEIATAARSILNPTLSSFSLPDQNELMNFVSMAKTRAYKVAWALRNPDREAAYKFRQDPTLGWIAVSGEDDTPARPVNVPSGIPIFAPGPDGKTPVQVSAYPQYEITVAMCPNLSTPPYAARYCSQGTQGSVPFQIRYTIASLSATKPNVVSAEPIITAVFPARGPITGGTLVHVSLAGGSATNASVTFGGVTPPQARCDSENCWFTTPANAKPGQVDIAVTAQGASAILPRVSSKPSPFTYSPNAELAGFGHDSSSPDPSAYVVSLDGNAPSKGATVTITSSDPQAVGVPQSVTIKPGQFGAIVPINFLPISKAENITLTAAYGGKPIPINVVAPAWPPISISLTSATVWVRGSTVAQATVTVKLGTRAPANGAAVTLTSSDPATIPNARNPIAPGAYSTTFLIVAHFTVNPKTGIPSTGKVVQLTATYAYNGASASISTPVPFQMGHQPGPTQGVPQ